MCVRSKYIVYQNIFLLSFNLELSTIYLIYNFQILFVIVLLFGI